MTSDIDQNPPWRHPDCTCPWVWRKDMGRLYGISMGSGWLRQSDAPDCEAMGWVPVFVAQPDDTGLMMEDEHDPKIRLLWEAAHAKSDEETCDGWHFVKCAGCDGSGRVSWAVTVTRIPRWLWKGITFYRFAMQPTVSPDGWTWRRRFKNYLNAAFLEDLRRLSR